MSCNGILRAQLTSLRQTVHMEALRVGQHALLVECADAAAVAATYRVVLSQAEALGAEEIVPAAGTVLLDGLADPEAALEVLAGLEIGPTWAGTEEPAGPMVELPTRYDGPDLEEVARQWDCSTDEVVRRHLETLFTVAFCGFAPGFAYCTGLPVELSVSRRAEPRPAVPAGSVALAGEYTGVYPKSTPGGWQVIGTTTASLWVPEADEPALLRPGTRVRFVDG